MGRVVIRDRHGVAWYWDEKTDEWREYTHLMQLADRMRDEPGWPWRLRLNAR